MDLGKISEQEFQELCQNLNWHCKKIPECEIKTPDFRVITPKGNFIAEVSAIDHQMEVGKAYSINVGEKVRQKISEKKKQLKGHDLPTLLILSGTAQHLGYESITAAMHGDITAMIGVESGKILDVYHGKGSRLQKKQNTSISAIGVLNRILSSKEQMFIPEPETMPHITIYHNMYAKHPFDRYFLKNNDQLHQYWFELDNTGTK